MSRFSDLFQEPVPAPEPELKSEFVEVEKEKVTVEKVASKVGKKKKEFTLD